jgi:hypothetical protein
MQLLPLPILQEKTSRETIYLHNKMLLLMHRIIKPNVSIHLSVVLFNNNIYLTAIGLSPGGSGYLTCIQI